MLNYLYIFKEKICWSSSHNLDCCVCLKTFDPKVCIRKILRELFKFLESLTINLAATQYQRLIVGMITNMKITWSKQWNQFLVLFNYFFLNWTFMQQSFKNILIFFFFLKISFPLYFNLWLKWFLSDFTI